MFGFNFSLFGINLFFDGYFFRRSSSWRSMIMSKMMWFLEMMTEIEKMKVLNVCNKTYGWDFETFSTLAIVGKMLHKNTLPQKKEMDIKKGPPLNQGTAEIFIEGLQRIGHSRANLIHPTDFYHSYNTKTLWKHHCMGKISSWMDLIVTTFRKWYREHNTCLWYKKARIMGI